MSMIQSDLLLGQEGGAGYTISRSLRFNSSDSAFLSRTPASAGNRKTWTWAGWVKRSLLGVDQSLFSSYTGSASDEAYTDFRFADDNTLRFGGWYTAWRNTSQVFRDTSAWYHIVLAVDISNATASERVKLYVNGSQVTAFAAENNPATTSQFAINSTSSHNLGANVYYTSTTQKFSGYLADVHFIDGQALDPSSFVAVSATTGQLIPKQYTGSFGTNGFWLKFSDNSAATATTLGKDYSGNNNNWSPSNLSIVSGGPTSVAAASGALPIYNTTDTYGATKGSGTRTDSNSSSIVLAIPMDGANNSTTFTDESATIKGSGSAKSITRSGDTKTSTAQSKYYGSSGYFDGTGDYLTVATSSDFAFGTGDFTVETWVYISSASAFQGIFQATTDNLNIQRNSLGNLEAWDGSTRSSSSGMPTNTWHHIAFTRSSGTAYVFLNGIQALTWSSSVNYSSSMGMVCGYTGNGSFLLTGYLQDFRVYKGVAKYTSNFNPPSATQNPTVAAGFDSTVDTPSSAGTDTGLGGQVAGNYCTWNPLSNTAVTLSNGNLDGLTIANNAFTRCNSTISVSSGKWYFEVLLNVAGTNTTVGIGQNQITSQYPGQDALSYVQEIDNARKGNSDTFSSYGSSLVAGDVFMCAFDLDNNKVFFGKNGSWFGSSNPASGTNPAYTLSTGTYCPITRPYGNLSGSISANFGQRQWAYAAPAGFKALCDTNLPAPVVAKPNTLMDVVTYTGTGASRSITSLNFSPDFVWIKERGNAAGHNSYDIVRGASVYLASESTSAEGTDTDALTAFNSNGFSLGSGYTVKSANGSGRSYVAWCWDAGSSTVTNTQGSITSQVRANASAGFSIVTYSTPASGAYTVGHGLGVAPSMFIVKARNGTGDWVVYHSSIGAGNNLILNTAAAQNPGGVGFWNSTAPTSTVLSIGANVVGSFDIVAYCFAPVAGYSAMGSYTGNGSTDGPFCFTGMRPRWLMVKRSDSNDGGYAYWTVFDSARNTYNLTNLLLHPNLSNAEYTDSNYAVDFLANGFKVREDGGGFNANGGTFIWVAFAESPFQYARAR